MTAIPWPRHTICPRLRPTLAPPSTKPASLDDERGIRALGPLVHTLARALDIREIFSQLSAAARDVVHHDEAALALVDPAGTRLRLYASTCVDGPEEIEPCDHRIALPLDRATVFQPSPGRPFSVGVQAPVGLGGERVGVLVFLSRAPYAYSETDVWLVERIADGVALALSHQRLADEIKRQAVEREHAANMDASEELLDAIAGSLDIREVFQRVSEIAAKVLPHDCLTMSLHHRDGVAIVHATSNTEGPLMDQLRIVVSGVPDTSAVRIIDDLAIDPPQIVEPADLPKRLVAAGYRSLLVVKLPAGHQAFALQFWSRQSGAFTTADGPIARRIARHVALCVSHERLAEAAREASEARQRADRLEVRVRTLTDELDRTTGVREIVGESAAWKRVLKAATQVAPTDTTVLLTGESGTGKEVIARFIRRASTRHAGPFVALNCAALPDELLEAELFGYERGAYTGATHAKPGQIELAAGGVLFLDEIGDMSPMAQAKLLRVLQEREFQRLGGTRVLKANVRVIAATNRNLRQAIERSEFREDLFYRLQVFEIALPPLREREDDVLLLASAFLSQFAPSRNGGRPIVLTDAARDVLLRHAWPGNVRELRNALERALIVCDGGPIDAVHLSIGAERTLPPGVAGVEPGPSDLATIERRTIARGTGRGTRQQVGSCTTARTDAHAAIWQAEQVRGMSRPKV